jgi:PKD repeat protein
MKTNHFFLLAIFAAFVAFTACDKDEDPKPTPSAGFTVSKDTSVVDEELQFTNTSTNATSFAWSFGDGNTSSEPSPKHTYTTSNVFVVTLSATGAGGTELFTKNIRVLTFHRLYCC